MQAERDRAADGAEHEEEAGGGAQPEAEPAHDGIAARLGVVPADPAYLEGDESGQHDEATWVHRREDARAICEGNDGYIHRLSDLRAQGVGGS
ncbi:MAG: hypothetical protein NVS9B8_13170 [Candidatus Limnocylindrales bacterium]